jgi:hypothetical protein
MFVILTGTIVFSGLLTFAFPALIVGIELTASKIGISYFGITVKSIPYSKIAYVGRGSWSGADFRGILDGLFTMRIVTSWTTRWVVIKLKPGAGFFRNWVIYVRDPDDLIESVKAKASNQ